MCQGIIEVRNDGTLENMYEKLVVHGPFGSEHDKARVAFRNVDMKLVCSGKNKNQRQLVWS